MLILKSVMSKGLTVGWVVEVSDVFTYYKHVN